MESKTGKDSVTRGKSILQNLEFDFRGRVVGRRKWRVSTAIRTRGRRTQKGREATQRSSAEGSRSIDTVSRKLYTERHAGVTQ